MKALFTAILICFFFSIQAQEKELKVVTVKQTAGGIPMKKSKVVVVEKKDPVVVKKKVHKHKWHYHNGKKCKIAHRKKTIFQK